MKWPFRKKKETDMGGIADAALDLQNARRDRERAQQALADARERQAEVHTSLVEPLRRARRDMLEYNHVYDDVMRHLRGSQP